MMIVHMIILMIGRRGRSLIGTWVEGENEELALGEYLMQLFRFLVQCLDLRLDETSLQLT